MIKDMTNPAWAAVFMLMACVTAVIALFSHSANAASVITMGSSIITGAFGYIQGVRVGRSSVTSMASPVDPLKP